MQRFLSLKLRKGKKNKNCKKNYLGKIFRICWLFGVGDLIFMPEC